jgi:hypothetical protein
MLHCQVLPAGKPFSEKFSITERRRLLRSIQNLLGLFASSHPPSALPHIIFLSGDVHYAEMMEIRCPLPLRSDLPQIYPILEITSSGMTHSVEKQIPFGLGSFFVENVLRTEHRIGSHAYSDLNFGKIEIDWSSTVPLVTAVIYDENGKERIRHKTSSLTLASQFEMDQTANLGTLCLNEETKNPWYHPFTMEVIRDGVVSTIVGSVILSAYYWWKRRR